MLNGQAAAFAAVVPITALFVFRARYAVAFDAIRGAGGTLLIAVTLCESRRFTWRVERVLDISFWIASFDLLRLARLLVGREGLRKHLQHLGEHSSDFRYRFHAFIEFLSRGFHRLRNVQGLELAQCFGQKGGVAGEKEAHHPHPPLRQSVHGSVIPEQVLQGGRLEGLEGIEGDKAHRVPRLLHQEIQLRHQCRAVSFRCFRVLFRRLLHFAQHAVEGLTNQQQNILATEFPHFSQMSSKVVL